jgi:hypothetical protein
LSFVTHSIDLFQACQVSQAHWVHQAQQALLAKEDSLVYRKSLPDQYSIIESMVFCVAEVATVNQACQDCQA